MNIRELKALLADYPDDMLVSINVETRWPLDEIRVELRDILDGQTWDDPPMYRRTILSIQHYNYGKNIGYKRLTENERLNQRREVLDGLADARSPFKHAVRKFTSRHGDYRIYNDLGGSNDTCYGTVYDPRVFLELESDGLIRRSRAPSLNYVPNYEITEAGLAEARHASGHSGDGDTAGEGTS